MLIYNLSLPKQTEWNTKRAQQLMEQLLFAHPSLIFRIAADHTRMQWQIIDPLGDDPGALETALRASYPEVMIRVDPFNPCEITSPVYRYVLKYQYGVPVFVAPIRSVNELKTSDPLAAVTQTMSQLLPNERVIYTLIVVGVSPEAYQEGGKLLTRKVFTGSLWDFIFTPKVERYTPQLQRVMEAKLQQRLYQCLLMIQVDTPYPERFPSLLTVDAQLVNFDHPEFNGLRWYEERIQDEVEYIDNDAADLESSALGWYTTFMQAEHKQADLKELRSKLRLVLMPAEVASLWHLPHEEHRAETIEWMRGAHGPLPQSMKGQHDGLCLGMNHYLGREEAAYLPTADRATHCLIVGKTGTGKSNLLHHLIHQDIQSGKGVAVIDPHGQLIQHILQRSIPPHREKDVVILDLANQQYPPPLNPLLSSQAQHYTSTLRVVGIIERLFAGTEQAARMSSYLRAALLLIQQQPQATMRDVVRVFGDDVYRESLLTRIDDPETQDFWDFQYNSLSAAMQRQLAEPIINRLRPFYANPTLYPMLCHPDVLDFGALMKQNKIILISLAVNEEFIPEQERNLIGALLVSQLQMSGMKERHQPFYIYIDEVQKFVTTSLSEMLSEARKYGLSLTTANQFLGQLTGKTLEAVMGNVGTTIVFGCSPEDTRSLATYMKPEFAVQDLLNLDRFQAVVKLQINGSTQPAFSLQTLPPIPTPNEASSREQYLRRLSIQGYTPKNTETVLSWLKERYPRRGAPIRETVQDEESAFYE